MTTLFSFIIGDLSVKRATLLTLGSSVLDVCTKLWGYPSCFLLQCSPTDCWSVMSQHFLNASSCSHAADIDFVIALVSIHWFFFLVYALWLFHAVWELRAAGLQSYLCSCSPSPNAVACESHVFLHLSIDWTTMKKQQQYQQDRCRMDVGVYSGYSRNTPEANTDLTSYAERSVMELTTSQIKSLIYRLIYRCHKAASARPLGTRCEKLKKNKSRAWLKIVT